VGLCNDKSTTYLKSLGYNVVRHPREGIGPLDLIGRQGKTTAWLGSIDKLITRASGASPTPDRDLAATDINGQQSSKLKLGVGANVLGSIIGAMGGNLGVDTSYTNARTISFQFHDVLSDRVAPLAVGDYLRDGDVDADNPILQEYVLGNGELFTVIETVKAKSLSVKYEREDGVNAAVDVPVIQGIVGANVEVSTHASSTGTVTYKGQKQLVFGFRCFAVGVLDGDLRLTTSKAGAVPLAVGESSADAAIAADSTILVEEGAGLLELETAAV
jgi:hypothetical protein